MLLLFYPKILFSPVFFAGGDSSADVPFLLVDFEHMLHLTVELWIRPAQTFGHVLVDCAFADAKDFGCTSDRRVVFHDVPPEDDASIFNSFHLYTL
jgi:hypothetical protein